jgi:eukaryotic-like serine/threonine-protein kinase
LKIAALALITLVAFAVYVWLGRGKQKSTDAGSKRRPAEVRPGLDTARILNNFEQKFAELKGRRPDLATLTQLYDLGVELEKRRRLPQATAVYRYLARMDNTFRDVGARLRNLVDSERMAATDARAAATQPKSKATAAAGAKPKPAADDGKPRLGRYVLEREIGRGAMGVVHLGRDSAINRLVAIKAIPLASEFAENELGDVRARFFREAETAGRLNHPNIVTIYDVGEQDNVAYIAMEYLKGQHLSDFSTQDKLLPPAKVLELMSRAASALGFAHKQNVIHRDVKPANMMYDPIADTLKITDFGIARLTDTASTRTGIVLGTPSFMSPEQLEGRIVNGSSDLFSLGVTLFQLLTGILPFRADSMTGLMEQIAERPHPPLRSIRPDLPPCFGGIIDRALAKSPEARFENGAQMAAAIDACRAQYQQPAA